MKSTRLLLASAFSLLAAASSHAVTTYALTDTGSVLTFDHATPGTLLNNVPVTGLGGYELLAIDVRPTVQAGPANPGVGTLWAIGRLGTSYQLFVIDPATGAAAAIGVPIAAGINSVPGTDAWGFDFNPSVDRIRLVDSAGDNYRLNPNNGTLVFTDGALAFSAGDPNFGTAPQVDAAAYTSAGFGGATSLFYLDANLDILAGSMDPNSGGLQTIGALGVNIETPNGFDIFGNLALFSVPGVTGSTLYSVNLGSGAAALVGNFPLLTNVRGLAISVLTPLPPVNEKPVVRVIGKLRKTTKNSRFDVRFRATDDSGVVVASFRQVRESKSFKVVNDKGTGIYTAIARRLKIGNNPVNVRAIDPEGRQTTVKVTVRRDRRN